MKKIGFINEHNYTKEKIKSLPVHKKVRGIIFKDKNTIVCIEENFYGIKHLLGLPGGTLNKNENYINAFKREVLEETGYNIKNIKFIGFIDSVRSKYITHTLFYTAKTKGKRSSIQLTEEEIETETKPIEMNIKKAVQKIKSQYNKSPNDNSLRSLMVLNGY